MPTLPSGFVFRTKGKVSFGAQNPVQETIETISIGTTGASTAIYPGGMTILRSTAGAAVVTLPVPEPGIRKVITVSTMSSAHISVKTNSTTGVFVDSTTTNIWNPSTTISGLQTIEIACISTALWVTLGFSTSGSTSVWTAAS